MKALNQYLRHQIDRQLGSMNIVKDQSKKRMHATLVGRKICKALAVLRQLEGASAYCRNITYLTIKEIFQKKKGGWSFFITHVLVAPLGEYHQILDQRSASTLLRAGHQHRLWCF